MVQEVFEVLLGAAKFCFEMNDVTSIDESILLYMIVARRFNNYPAILTE